ncbi:MAG: putative metal-dependent hydrolase [Acidobacteria bacterium]|nr:putative metal-dependent hydrolase [Acidobacteriota bacterium]
MPSEDLAYPIGPFEMPGTCAPGDLARHLDQIEALPLDLRHAVAGLDEAQLDTPYRPGGWTVRQVVHHLPDSHLNAYLRFKFALTEEEPLIKPYFEARWAELPEAKGGAPSLSLDLLQALHARWMACARALSPEAFSRRFRHPDLGPMSLDQQLALYAWHGRHHLAHVTHLRQRMGW